MEKQKINKIVGISSAIMMTAAFGMIMGGGGAGNRPVEVAGIIIMGVNSLYWAIYLIKNMKNAPED